MNNENQQPLIGNLEIITPDDSGIDEAQTRIQNQIIEEVLSPGELEQALESDLLTRLGLPDDDEQALNNANKVALFKILTEKRVKLASLLLAPKKEQNNFVQQNFGGAQGESKAKKQKQNTMTSEDMASAKKVFQFIQKARKAEGALTDAIIEEE